MFRAASSARQALAAHELALFITNAEQETVLMRQAGRIPANSRVTFNPRLDAIASAFVSQSKTAIPFVNTAGMEVVIRYGDDAYKKALQGVLDPISAVQQTALLINQTLGFPDAALNPTQCEGFGVVNLWHSGSSQDAGVLGHLLIPSDWLPALVARETVRETTSLVDGQVLQRHSPAAVDALRAQDELFGLPLTMQSRHRDTISPTGPAPALRPLLGHGIPGPTPVGADGRQVGWQV